MRWVAAVLLMAGCAGNPASVPYVLTAADHARLDALNAQEAAGGQRRDAADPSITPEQRARRRFEDARTTRENELLARALSASPDYTAAVRRAADQNVTEEAALPITGRRPPVNTRAREAAISAEEARLSEAVEARRRQQLAQRAQVAQTQQDQQMAAQCIALGQQIEASMFNRRSLLNLEGTIAGAQARDNCWANYQQRR